MLPKQSRQPAQATALNGPGAFEFTRILGASFISQTGTHFLTIALAAYVFVSSGSTIQSALVFVVSFLPSILVSAELGDWIDRRLSRLLIVRNDLIAAALSALCGACIYFKMPLVLLCAALSVRSILSFTGRAAATKWIKLITPPELQDRRNKLFFLSFFLSTALAGVLAGVVLAHGSIVAVVTIDILTYLLGIGLVMTLRAQPEGVGSPAAASGQARPKLLDTLRCILQMPSVRTSFLLVCFSQAIFQGAYSVLVSYLPIRHFALDVSSIGLFQLATSIGLTAGFLLVWFFPSKINDENIELPLRAIGISAVAVVAALLLSVSHSLPFSLFLFMVFNLAYECVWLHHSTKFFRASPKNYMARYQFTISACGAFFMSISTLGYSAAIESFGLGLGVTLILASGLIFALLIATLSSKSVVIEAMNRETL